MTLREEKHLRRYHIRKEGARDDLRDGLFGVDRGVNLGEITKVGRLDTRHFCVDLQFHRSREEKT